MTLKQGLLEHKAGKSVHTQRYKPWNLVCFLGFAGEKAAIQFEKYLKSGSGRSFANRRLWHGP